MGSPYVEEMFTFQQEPRKFSLPKHESPAIGKYCNTRLDLVTDTVINKTHGCYCDVSFFKCLGGYVYLLIYL
jgi:hypothetical protein